MAIPQDRHMLTLLQVIWYWESFLKHKQAREIGWLPSNSLSPQFYRPLFPFQPIQPQISISREREREIERKRWVEKNGKRGGLRDGMERGRERKWRPKRLGVCVSWRKFFSTFRTRAQPRDTSRRWWRL